MPHDETVFIANAVGILAAFFTVGIPLAIWFFGMRKWHTNSRQSFALKISLWPLVIFSSQLGGPIARMIVGLPTHPYRLDVFGTLQGLIGIAIVTIPVMFGIGYLIAIKKFPRTG